VLENCEFSANFAAAPKVPF